MFLEAYCPKDKGWKCSYDKRDGRTEAYIRPAQITIYCMIGFASAVTSIVFVMRVKRYMYLYFLDYRKLLFLNIVGLQVYILISVANLYRELKDAIQKGE